MKSTIGLSMILSVMLCVSCNKNEPDVLQEVVKINILPTIEINQDDYTPLRSASVENTLLYAVQIYEEDIPYYYGLFDDVSKMEIALTTNKNYTLKIAAYQAGTGSGLKSIRQNGVRIYYLPDTVSLLNKFMEGDRLTAISNINNAKLVNNRSSKYPEIDAFYHLETFTVIKGMSSIDILLKRTGFGLGFSVDGLKSGRIEVYFAGDTIQLIPTINSYFTIRSFVGEINDLVNVAKVDTYFVHSIIGVKWIGDNGTIVTASKMITLKRNFQLPLFINLNSSNTGITFESWQNAIADSLINNKMPIIGLVAWYPFEGNANDESGNNNNGTVIGNVALTTDRFNNQNKAFEFPGIEFNYIRVEDSPTLKLNSFTINAWIYTSTDYGFGYLVNKSRDVTAGHYGLSVNYVVGRVSYYNCVSAAEIPKPSINKWHMITGIVSGNKSCFYLDGELKSDTVAPVSFASSGSEPLTIGMHYYTGIPRSWAYPYKGKVDDVGIWNRSLTQQEILDLYNYK